MQNMKSIFVLVGVKIKKKFSGFDANVALIDSCVRVHWGRPN